MNRQARPGTGLPLLAGLALAACGRPAPPSNEAVGAAVIERFNALVGAIRRLEVDSMLGFYAEDSTVVRAVDGVIIAGRQSVENDFRAGFGAVRSFDQLNIEAHHLAVTSPESAVLTVRLEEQFTDTAGHSNAMRATWTTVWRKQTDGWRIVHDAAVHVPLVAHLSPK